MSNRQREPELTASVLPLGSTVARTTHTLLLAAGKRGRHSLSSVESVRDEQRWCFVPMSMECFGRFGVHTAKFLHELSWHAAHVRGGVQADVKRRCRYTEAQLRGESSVALAKANAERLVNYITGVAEHRGFISPVSALPNYYQ